MLILLKGFVFGKAKLEYFYQGGGKENGDVMLILQIIF
jgi:hypothetical protein